ncbi:4-hydroxybenzoate polyprenyl transferase [Auriculariales sp. MPI-PUGE-AT-0066]|nr:4-hydroxybenzoate polyprenyl transferase [Auriculariales sp. MPI-PUGE-AT-0066]
MLSIAARVGQLQHRAAWQLHAPALSRFGARSLSYSLRRCSPSTPPERFPDAAALSTAASPILPPVSWVERLPQKWRPYAYLTRIDKPIGTSLLFLPCGWSIAMASYATHAPPSVMLGTTALFATGALVMRGAGCTINDMWDRNLDNKVDRTKNRPLARLGFLAAQLTVGLGVLLQLNWYSILLGASSLSLVTVYPLMKRITYWPQFVLGLAFNWGALLGWSAVAGSVDWKVALPLYASGVSWTLLYDTIYAHQDKVDDAQVGIRSTALLFGERTRPILSAFAASHIGLLAASGMLNENSWIFFAGLGAGALQTVQALRQTDFDSRESCWKGFVGCGWAGALVWFGAAADWLVAFAF